MQNASSTPSPPDFVCAFTGDGRMCDRCYQLHLAGRETATAVGDDARRRGQ
jgi:hypothetical protein